MTLPFFKRIMTDKRFTTTVKIAVGSVKKLA